MATKRAITACGALLLGMLTTVPRLVGQEAPHREFSANVLMRMATEKWGIGARVYVKEDDLYLDFPANGLHIPVWFLSDGVVTSVEGAWSDEDSNEVSGLADPLSSGDPFSVAFFLRFRPLDPALLCEEFRSAYIEFIKASGGLGEEDLKNLQKPQHFRCEPTGQETVALRVCRTYRLGSGLSEYWTAICFDPKLTAILKVQWNPPQGAILRLDAIKEGPQPSSLFVPPPDRVVVVDPGKPKKVSGAAVGTTTNASQVIPQAHKWGPEALWNPSPSVLQEMLQRCRGEAAKCLELFMPKAGASPEAIAFARSLGFQGFMSGYRPIGEVNLATITYPFRANTNEVPALVAGAPLVIDVLDIGGQADLTHDPVYRSVVKSFPNAELEGAIPTFLRMEPLPEGGQRFIFIFPVQNGCRACETVAAASVAFDFNSAGVFGGLKLLGVKAPVPAATTSSHGTAREQSQAGGPEEAAERLYSAFKACDKSAALTVAPPGSVAKLWGKGCQPWKAGWPEWEFTGCRSETSSYLCGFYHEGGFVNMHMARRPSGTYYVSSVDLVAD